MKEKKKVKVVGLTGGIGSGKSTLAQILKLKGAIVVDADEVARDVIAPSSAVWKKLVDHFGEQILLRDNTIDRKKLGNIVFFDSEELEALDRFTHPAIREAIRRRIARLKKKADDGTVIVLDAPLLVETGLVDDVDVVVVVKATQAIRLERLRKIGLTVREAKARMKSQTPDTRRTEYADRIIENEGSFKDLQRRAGRLWRSLMKEFQVPEQGLLGRPDARGPAS